MLNDEFPILVISVSFPIGYNLSALIRKYCHVFSEILFHHRVTENTENLFLFAHRETAMGKKICTPHFR